MKFLDFDRERIRADAEIEGSYYVYSVGAPIEVLSVGGNENELLAKRLSTGLKDDRLMTKYCPTNKVYFSRGVVENVIDDDFVSFYVDEKNCRLYVGSAEEYGRMSGVLTFSGYMSLNRLVEENKNILCTQKMIATVFRSVRILALGLVGDSIFGLMYIPGLKGVKIAERGNHEYGVSPITYKSGICRGYKLLTINSWFNDLTRIKEVEVCH